MPVLDNQLFILGRLIPATPLNLDSRDHHFHHVVDHAEHHQIHYFPF